MMETEESPAASSNIATPKAGSALRDKKKKLKAVFRKRHHGLVNLSIRNSTLNSTIFKASLKINNRALAQALEKKKSEYRAAEAIILQLREEIQLLTAELNKEKMIAVKTKRYLQERLEAVSGTMGLAVDQLVEAMDVCTDGDFRKLSGPFMPPAVSTLVMPSINEEISLKPACDVNVRPVAGPSRVTMSAVAATATCDNDEDQDVIVSMDHNKEPPLCDAQRLPAPDLSIIMEQSYLVPSEIDLTYDDPVLGYRRSNSRDRRNTVFLQPSLVDSPSPAEDEGSRQDVYVRSKTRSRSRPSFGLSTGEMNMVQDAGITRSKSRDRRNAMIFHPSSTESPSEDRSPAGKCVRILRRSRNPSGQFRETPALKSGQVENSEVVSEATKFKEPVAVAPVEVDRISGEEEEGMPSFLDETLVSETVTLSSEMVGRLGQMQSLATDGKINKGNVDDGSMELVEETILIPYEESSYVAETVMEPELSHFSVGERKNLPSNKASVIVCESLTGSKISTGIQQKSLVSNFALVDEAEGLVNRGQFATRDKIARTPVKAVRHFHEGEEERTGIWQSADLSDISDRELNESENRRSRSLSRRDIPTFMAIESPNASGTTRRMSKGATSTTKGQTKCSNFLKKGTKGGVAGSSELKERKAQNKPGLVVGHQDAEHRSDGLCAGSAQLSRRETFAIPKGSILFEADIMMEDDSVLINESAESCLGIENNVFDDVDEHQRDGVTGSIQVESVHVEQPTSNLVTQNALAERNVTILMAEDMEQTGVSFSAISIIDPPAGIRQIVETNSVANSSIIGKVQNGNPCPPEKHQVGLDELALGEKRSKLLLPASCSDSVRVKAIGKDRKVNSKETTCSNEIEVRNESAEDDLEPTANVVKRRRVVHSKLKLPTSGTAAAVGVSGEKDAKSPPRTGATKRSAVLDNPVQNCNNRREDNAFEGEDIQEQSMDVELKKRFAAYLSKPGNIVFNADRKDATGNEVAKKTRSKSRSILPLQQKPRSKTAATSAKPEEEEGMSSVWDFRGTPRLAAAKESADRLLSVYDISLNDSGVIPKPNHETDPVQCPKKKRSKDDSFIVDKKPPAGKRRARHESASAIDSLATSSLQSQNVLKGALESPHGIMLALGNRRKASTRSKTVRYDVESVVQNKADTDQGNTNSLPSEMSKVDVNQVALKPMSSTLESDLASKLKSAETAVTVESMKEPSTEASQLEVSHDQLVLDLDKDYAEEETERIPTKDVPLENGKSRDDGLGHSVRGAKAPESHSSKDVTQRKQGGRATVKNNDSVATVNGKNAAGNVKASDAEKRGQRVKGRGVANPRKEKTKDGSNSLKDCKTSDFSPVSTSDVLNIDTLSSQVSSSLDDAETTVLYANKERSSELDMAAKSDANSTALHELLKRREADVLEQFIDEQRLGSLHVEKPDQPNETESPRQVAAQRKARKRRVVQSTDLFEDIDTRSLHSPKSKQPALAEEERHPVTSAGVSKTLLKPSNHRQVESPTARRGQSELAKLQGPLNARRNHDSLRLRKNLKVASTKATPAKTPENGNVAETPKSGEEVFRQLVSEQPLAVAEKTADTKKKSSAKDSSAVPPRRRTNLSTKNSKEKISRQKSTLPTEEHVLLCTDILQTNDNVVEVHKDLDLQEDGSNANKLKKKRCTILDRLSSMSTGSFDTSSQAEAADRRTRRNAAQAVSYKEPSLGKKLRRGDPHTSTIYGGANPEHEKHHGSERTSDARLSRRVLSTMENTSMETE